MTYQSPRKYYNNNPRYNYSKYNNSDSEETSSTQSVRVSRLIEKIKAQQKPGYYGHGNHNPPPFSYSNDLIYSRVAREQDQKRTVRERVAGPSNGANYHKTTVLLNNDSDSDWNYGKTNNERSRYDNGLKQRYFGEETDYEYDRELSREVRSGGGFNTLSRRNEWKGETGTNNARSSVPKIILHEEAVAEIPNGKMAQQGSLSPSFLDEQEEQSKTGGSRFLGGLLTLKRGNKGTLRSNTRSPDPQQRRTASYLNVPSATNQRHLNTTATHDEHDSSSSPKYYVPYYRSTPTLYESRYDRMSSTGGSVLSNGSYVNKHVSRSLSMKAPWQPRHRANEIDYYQDSYKSSPQQPETKKRTLTRSKSMPGKKLSNIIGSWVTKNSKRHGSSPEKEETKLIDNGSNSTDPQQQKPLPKGKSSSNWGRFTLLRFGKNKEKKEKEVERVPRSLSPERPIRTKNRYHQGQRDSVSPVRGTLRRGDYKKYSSGSGGGGGGTSSSGRFY